MGHTELISSYWETWHKKSATSCCIVIYIHIWKIIYMRVYLYICVCLCLYSLMVLQNLMNQINDKFTTRLDKKIQLVKLRLKLTALTNCWHIYILSNLHVRFLLKEIRKYIKGFKNLRLPVPLASVCLQYQPSLCLAVLFATLWR